MRNEISQAQRVHELPRRARDGSEIERSSPPPRGPASFTRRPCGNARQISPKNAHPVPAPSPHLKKSITSSKLASFQSRIRMKQLLSLCVQPVIQRSCRYARFNSQRGLDLPLGERGRDITISHPSAAPSSQNPGRIVRPQDQYGAAQNLAQAGHLCLLRRIGGEICRIDTSKGGTWGETSEVVAGWCARPAAATFDGQSVWIANTSQ